MSILRSREIVSVGRIPNKMRLSHRLVKTVRVKIKIRFMKMETDDRPLSILLTLLRS